MAEPTSTSWDHNTPDTLLITAVRQGDSGAFGVLFTRHGDAARTVARQYLSADSDVEDVVADGFERVLGILRDGGGPDVAFRAYLFTVIRRLSYTLVNGARRTEPTDDETVFESVIGPLASVEEPALRGFEDLTVAKAYESLPERWRSVLWYTDIEEMAPAKVAPIFGLTANGVAALAYRAREGLRQAYLQQHLTQESATECLRPNKLFGSYVRGGLSRRETTIVEEHLDVCVKCGAVVLELGDVSSGMRSVIAPLVLGLAGVGALVAGGLPVWGAGIAAAGVGSGASAAGAGTGGAGAATTGSQGSTGSAGFTAAASQVLTPTVILVGAGGVVAVAAFVAVAAVTGFFSSDSKSVADDAPVVIAPGPSGGAQGADGDSESSDDGSEPSDGGDGSSAGSDDPTAIPGSDGPGAFSSFQPSEGGQQNPPGQGSDGTVSAGGGAPVVPAGANNAAGPNATGGSGGPAGPNMSGSADGPGGSGGSGAPTGPTAPTSPGGSTDPTDPTDPDPVVPASAEDIVVPASAEDIVVIPSPTGIQALGSTPMTTTVQNTAKQPASDVEVVLDLVEPASFTSDNAGPGGGQALARIGHTRVIAASIETDEGWTCEVTDQKATCEIDEIGAGESSDLTLDVTYARLAGSSAREMKMTVTVRIGEDTKEHTFSTPILRAPAKLAVEVDPNSALVLGHDGFLTVYVTNQGEESAQGLTLDLALPEGLEWVTRADNWTVDVTSSGDSPWMCRAGQPPPGMPDGDSLMCILEDDVDLDPKPDASKKPDSTWVRLTLPVRTTMVPKQGVDFRTSIGAVEELVTTSSVRGPIFIKLDASLEGEPSIGPVGVQRVRTDVTTFNSSEREFEDGRLVMRAPAGFTLISGEDCTQADGEPIVVCEVDDGDPEKVTFRIETDASVKAGTHEFDFTLLGEIHDAPFKGELIFARTSAMFTVRSLGQGPL